MQKRMHKIQAIFYIADIIIATDNLISYICYVNDQMYILDIPRSKLRNQNGLQTLTVRQDSDHEQRHHQSFGFQILRLILY